MRMFKAHGCEELRWLWRAISTASIDVGDADGRLVLSARTPSEMLTEQKKRR